MPPQDEVGLGALEAALDKVVRAIPVETKLRDAVPSGRARPSSGPHAGRLGLAAGVIGRAEYDLLNDARNACDDVIQVDAFDPETFKTLR